MSRSCKSCRLFADLSYLVLSCLQMQMHIMKRRIEFLQVQHARQAEIYREITSGVRGGEVHMKCMLEGSPKLKFLIVQLL